MNNLIEKLAELEHEQWMSWAKAIIKNEPLLSLDRKKRWQQYFISYNELPEDIKDLDREYAKRTLNYISECFKQI